jgi:hypothetical protein
LNLAVHEKEAMTVAGLATTTSGMAIAMTRCHCCPSIMETIVPVIIAAIVNARDIHVMTSNKW